MQPRSPCFRACASRSARRRWTWGATRGSRRSWRTRGSSRARRRWRPTPSTLVVEGLRRSGEWRHRSRAGAGSLPVLGHVNVDRPQAVITPAVEAGPALCRGRPSITHVIAACAIPGRRTAASSRGPRARGCGSARPTDRPCRTWRRSVRASMRPRFVLGPGAAPPPLQGQPQAPAPQEDGWKGTGAGSGRHRGPKP